MRKPPISGIYCFENKINNKRYIGSSKDIVERYKRHLRMIVKNVHVNSHFQSAINKYGFNNFSFIVLEQCSENDLLTREQYYIDSYEWSTLYNKTKIALGGGSDAKEYPIIMLDLKGNIVNEYKSGADIARFLKRKSITYTSINTPTILQKKYRLVTPEFFAKNKQEVLSWRSYSNEAVYKKQQQILSTYKYSVRDIYNITTFCYTIVEVGKAINLTTERARQIINQMKNRKLTEYFHKSSGNNIIILKGN